MFTCSNCSHTFTRRDNARRHELRCTSSVKMSSHSCPHCEKKFNRSDAVLHHIRSIHKMVPPPPPPRASCSSGGVDVKRKLENRPKIQPSCQACNITFESIAKLSAHKKTQRHQQKISEPQDDAFVSAVRSAFRNRIISYHIRDRNRDDDAGTDIISFLTSVKSKVLELISHQLQIHILLKVNLELFAFFIKGGVEEEEPTLKSFNTKFKVVDRNTDLNELYELQCSDIKVKCEEFNERDSGFALSHISHLALNINKYTPIRGSSYLPLPKDIGNRNGCINIQSFGNDCFAHCIMAYLYPDKHSSNRISSYPPYANVLKFGDIEFPVRIRDIPQFESLNDLSINVYALEYNSAHSRNDVVGPIHYTKRKMNRHINLLLLNRGEIYHYCLIKNMSRLVSCQLSTKKTAHYLCDGCLSYFKSRVNFERHIADDCNKIRTLLPTTDDVIDVSGEVIPGNILKFKNYNHKMRIPFTVYADFESILKPIVGCEPGGSDTSFTQNVQEHIPYSFAYTIISAFDKSLNKFVKYSGLDCCEVFINRLSYDAKCLYHTYMKPIKGMETLSAEQSDAFKNATVCHICELPFIADDQVRGIRVRDHCHITGKFVGAAHSKCNVNFKIPKLLPVFFHNLSGYDSHLFIKQLALDNEKIEVIPQSMERYVSFTKFIKVDKYIDRKNKERDVTLKIRFLDSFRFMSSSIDKLSKNLDEHQFNNVKLHFPDRERMELLTRKGVFPYDYIKSFETLSETELPPIEQFHNSLIDHAISEDDYAHAQKVWNVFNCRNLLDYAELYVTTDVLLLADIFEGFRDLCISTYNLDPCHYFTAPGLSWDAFLKFTGVRLELLTDIDQHHFIKHGIRGGLCTSVLRYAKANNLHIPTYNNEEPTSYLLYLDANNLYGWSMSQYLPYGGFSWLSERDILELDDILTIPDEAPHGYIFEVDIEYPQHLHDLHNDLPFLPNNSVPPTSRFKNTKLIADFTTKIKYIIHYRNLKHCMHHGLKIIKVHRVLKFKQSDFMKPYIELNTNKRKVAKNAFEKDFYKLMNNSVYGKTMENVDKRMDLKLVNHWEDIGNRRGAQSLIAKPNFKSSTIFDENLSAIQLSRLKALYNKPIYIGFTVLDLSKLIMYEFYYDYLKPLYGDKMKLCYTDTDSFIVLVESEEAYENIRRDSHRFDTSNYSPDNPFNISLQNKAILGLMKDENAGYIMLEFISLRAKMYCFLVNDSWRKRAKGIKRSVVENKLTGSDYKKCLFQNKEIYRKQRLIRSIKHVLYTQNQNKLALSPHDDKRFISKNNIDTIAWAHYKLANITENSDDDDDDCLIIEDNV